MNSGGLGMRSRRAERTVVIWWAILRGTESMKGREEVRPFGGWER